MNARAPRRRFPFPAAVLLLLFGAAGTSWSQSRAARPAAGMDAGLSSALAARGWTPEGVFGSRLDAALVGRGSTLGSFLGASLPRAPESAPSVAAAPALLGSPERPQRPRGGGAGELERLRRVERLARRLPRHSDGLDAREREALYRALVLHPVAGLEGLDRYDPRGEIGFCFGRAMAAHLLALRMGLRPESIRKLFIVGDLRSAEGVAWRFHVTTLVRGSEGGWYAVDPVAGGPLSLEDWVRFIREGYDRERRAKLYLTAADAVMPLLETVPAPGSETGGRLIELSFEPEGRPGFERLGLPEGAAGPAYQVGARALSRYFDTTLAGRESFDFVRARVNGREYDYRGYFRDLLEAVLAGPVPGALSAASCAARGPACGTGATRAYAPPPGGGLFSPRMFIE